MFFFKRKKGDYIHFTEQRVHIQKQQQKKKDSQNIMSWCLNVLKDPTYSFLVILIITRYYLCLGKRRNTQKRSKDTLVQQNTAYLLTTGLGRSTWRLAAEDGNVHTYIRTHTSLCGIHYWWFHSVAFFLSDTVKRLSVMLPGWGSFPSLGLLVVH